MPNAWFQRLYLVLAVVLGSIYVLVPTFFWHPDDESVTAAGVDVTPVPTVLETPSFRKINETAGTIAAGTDTPAPPAADAMPPFMAFFPKKRLHLGLDLVGGSHLALGVDTDEALRAIVNRHRREAKERLTKEGIAFNTVTQPLGTASLQISLKSAADREVLRKFIREKVDARLEETGFKEEDGAGIATFTFTSDERSSIENQAVSQVLELLRTRVNSFGVSEPIIFREKSNRIVVELPGLKNPAKAIEEIKRTARLEFHIVDEDWYSKMGGDPLPTVVDPTRPEGLPTQQLRLMVADVLAAQPEADDAQINHALLGKIPEDSAVYFEKYNDAKGRLVRNRPMLLKREIALTGDRLENAFPTADQFNKWEVSIRFDAEGSDRFGDVTGANTNKRLAIVLEGNVKTWPHINERIDGGSARITLGSRTQQDSLREATDIARVLRTGALPAPVRIEQNRTVGPSLGQDAIRKGARSTLVGVMLVFMFALIWYRWSGAIAVVTLICNGIVLMGVMTVFDATLTLPGIAGIILTIGMAVDANVLIYERIREELRLGKAIRPSVDAGFEKAFSSIVDGNLTTAAAGVVLYFYGTDQIKGFAITLLLGISTTLFCALVITRLLLDWYTLRLKPAQLSI